MDAAEFEAARVKAREEVMEAITGHEHQWDFPDGSSGVVCRVCVDEFARLLAVERTRLAELQRNVDKLLQK